jgi:hypothetical protein
VNILLNFPSTQPELGEVELSSVKLVDMLLGVDMDLVVAVVVDVAVLCTRLPGWSQVVSDISQTNKFERQLVNGSEMYRSSVASILNHHSFTSRTSHHPLYQVPYTYCTPVYTRYTTYIIQAIYHTGTVDQFSNLDLKNLDVFTILP